MYPMLDEFVLDFDAEEQAQLQAQAFNVAQLSLLNAGLDAGLGRSAARRPAFPAINGGATRVRPQQRTVSPAINNGGQARAAPSAPADTASLHSELDALRREIARLESQQKNSAKTGQANARTGALPRQSEKGAAATPSIAGGAANASGVGAARAPPAKGAAVPGAQQPALKRARIAAPASAQQPGRPRASAAAVGTSPSVSQSATGVNTSTAPQRVPAAATQTASSEQAALAVGGAEALSGPLAGFKRQATEKTSAQEATLQAGQPRPQQQRRHRLAPQVVNAAGDQREHQSLPPVLTAGAQNGAIDGRLARLQGVRAAASTSELSNMRPTTDSAAAPQKHAGALQGGKHGSLHRAEAGPETVPRYVPRASATTSVQASGDAPPANATGPESSSCPPPTAAGRPPAQGRAGSAPPRKRARPAAIPEASTSTAAAREATPVLASEAMPRSAEESQRTWGEPRTATAVSTGSGGARTVSATTGSGSAGQSRDDSEDGQPGERWGLQRGGDRGSVQQAATHLGGNAEEEPEPPRAEEAGNHLPGSAGSRDVSSPEAAQAANAFLMSIMTQMAATDTAAALPEEPVRPGRSSSGARLSAQPVMEGQAGPSGGFAEAMPEWQDGGRSQAGLGGGADQVVLEGTAVSPSGSRDRPAWSAGPSLRPAGGSGELAPPEAAHRLPQATRVAAGPGASARRAAAERMSMAVLRLRRKSSGLPPANLPADLPALSQDGRVAAGSTEGGGAAALPVELLELAPAADGNTPLGPPGGGALLQHTPNRGPGYLVGHATVASMSTPEQAAGPGERRHERPAEGPANAEAPGSWAQAAASPDPGQADGLGAVGTPAAPPLASGDPRGPLASGAGCGAAYHLRQEVHASQQLPPPRLPAPAAPGPSAPGPGGAAGPVGAGSHAPPWVQVYAGGYQATTLHETSPRDPGREAPASVGPPQGRVPVASAGGLAGEGGRVPSAGGAAAGPWAVPSSGGAASGHVAPAPAPLMPPALAVLLADPPPAVAPHGAVRGPGALPPGPRPPVSRLQPGYHPQQPHRPLLHPPWPPGSFPSPLPGPPGAGWLAGPPPAGVPLLGGHVVSFAEVDMMVRKELLLLKWRTLQELAAEVQAEWYDVCTAHNRLRAPPPPPRTTAAAGGLGGTIGGGDSGGNVAPVRESSEGPEQRGVDGSVGEHPSQHHMEQEAELGPIRPAAGQEQEQQQQQRQQQRLHNQAGPHGEAPQPSDAFQPAAVTTSGSHGAVQAPHLPPGPVATGLQEAFEAAGQESPGALALSQQQQPQPLQPQSKAAPVVAAGEAQALVQGTAPTGAHLSSGASAADSLTTAEPPADCRSHALATSPPPSAPVAMPAAASPAAVGADAHQTGQPCHALHHGGLPPSTRDEPAPDRAPPLDSVPLCLLDDGGARGFREQQRGSQAAASGALRVPTPESTRDLSGPQLNGGVRPSGRGAVGDGAGTAAAAVSSVGGGGSVSASRPPQVHEDRQRPLPPGPGAEAGAGRRSSSAAAAESSVDRDTSSRPQRPLPSRGSPDPLVVGETAAGALSNSSQPACVDVPRGRGGNAAPWGSAVAANESSTRPADGAANVAAAGLGGGDGGGAAADRPATRAHQAMWTPWGGSGTGTTGAPPPGPQPSASTELLRAERNTETGVAGAGAGAGTDGAVAGNGTSDPTSGTFAGLSFKLRAPGRRVGPLRAQSAVPTATPNAVPVAPAVPPPAVPSTRSQQPRSQPSVCVVAPGSIAPCRRTPPALPVAFPHSAPPRDAAPCAAATEPAVRRHTAPPPGVPAAQPAGQEGSAHNPQSLQALPPAHNPSAFSEARSHVIIAQQGMLAQTPGQPHGSEAGALRRQRSSIGPLVLSPSSGQPIPLYDRLDCVLASGVAAASAAAAAPSVGMAAAAAGAAGAAAAGAAAQRSGSLLDVLSSKYKSPLSMFRSYGMNKG